MGRDNSMERRVITLSDFEHRLLTEALNDFRNKLIRTQKPTEDINELLLKVLDAPLARERRHMDRGMR